MIKNKSEHKNFRTQFKPLGSFVINKVRVHTYEHKANGLRVSLVPIPGETVAINVVNKFGSASELIKAKTGSLHLLEHLYFRIGKLSENKSIDKSVFALGMKTGAYQNAQTTASSMELITHGHVKYEEDMMKLFSERMTDYYIDPASKTAEEQAVFNEAQKSLKSPYMQVITKLSNIAMDKSGYSWMTIGDIADVANVTAKELSDLKQYFSKPNNTHIIVSGAASENTLKHIHTYFGAIPRGQPVERPGLKAADPQFSMRQASMQIDGNFPVIALGFHSPDRKPFQFTHEDVMLRIIQKAMERPEVQQQFGTAYVNSSVFNPEYCAPYLFSFLSVPQTDPSTFPQALSNALKTMTQLPEDTLKGIVKDLRYKMENSFTSAHAATELLAESVSTKKWNTLKSIHQKYCDMIKPGFNIQNELSNFIPKFFDFNQSTFIIGIPKSQVGQQISLREAPTPLEAPALNTNAKLVANSETAHPVGVTYKNHNIAVVQKTSPDIFINASVPFKADVHLKQEAIHSILANLLNATPLPSSVSASTRRSFSSGHDVFHISMKMKSSSGVQHIMDQFKTPDFSMFDNIKNTSASMARGEQMNATSMAKIIAINSIFDSSPFKNHENIPNQIQSTTLSELKKAHSEIIQNLRQGYFTFTGDWASEQDLDKYKQQAKIHMNADFTPLKTGGIARLKDSGEVVKIVDYVQENNTYTLDINGETQKIDSHLITTNVIPQFEWVPKTPKETFQHRELDSVATATVMYAVSFPREMNNAMKFVINMFSDSMSGWEMQRVRWVNCEQCYGINGQVVSTNMKSPPLAVMVGTVGSEALGRAKDDIQQVLDEHVNKITQDQLDTTYARMEGEMTVKADYAEDIHSIVHADLVAGNTPTLHIVKPTLKEVNEASTYLQHMAKVEIVPTQSVSAAKTYHTTAAYDSDDNFEECLDYDSDVPQLNNLRF